MTDPPSAGAAAEDDELRAYIFTICDIGFPTAREKVDAIMKLIHAHDDNTGRQLAAAGEEIARLKEERDAAREALRPFVFGVPVMEEILWGHLPDEKQGTITTNLGAFRRARAVLATSVDGDEHA